MEGGENRCCGGDTEQAESGDVGPRTCASCLSVSVPISIAPRLMTARPIC